MTTKKTLATLLGLLLAGSLSMATAACGDTGAANPDSGADAASQTEGAADAADTGAGFEEIPIGTDVELEGEINAAAVYSSRLIWNPPAWA